MEPRIVIICSCKNISHLAIQKHLPQLNPCLPFADLSEKTRIATVCGFCKGDTQDVMAKYKGSEERRLIANRIHAPDKTFLLYSGFDAVKDHVQVLPKNNQKFYSVMSLTGQLEDIRKMAPVLGDTQLFAVALDHGRQLFLNESELPADRWLASLTEGSAFQAWTQINTGCFEKWDPDKIDRKALLRFLLSEIEFVRGALKASPLQAVIAAGPYDSDFASFPTKLTRDGPPIHRLLTSEEPRHHGTEERAMTVPTNLLVHGMKTVVDSISRV